MKPAYRIASFVSLITLSLLMACSKEDEPKLNANIAVEAKSVPLSATVSQQSKVVVTDFKINIKEVEFEFDKADPRSSTEIEIKDIKLKTPFELDLLNGNTSITTLLNSIELPNATYEEVEFKMHKAVSGPMTGKSIVMSGTINGKPFEFWHDTDEEFEIDFTDGNKDFVVNGADQKLTIAFNLNTLLTAVTGVDLTVARDGNGNGVIEINPNDNDGNKDLAHLIKKEIEEATDLLDDK